MRSNLLTLQSNLSHLGYAFANPLGPVQLADEASLNILDRIEREKGKLPILYRRWYEMFHSVDFSQDKSQLHATSEHKLAGLGLNCPLIFLSLDTCIKLQAELSAYGYYKIQVNGMEFIPTGDYASNCEPKGVWIPSDEFDPVLYDAGGGPVSFSQSLRTAIDAGGFPFWQQAYTRRTISSPLQFNPAYKEIQNDLLRNIVL